MVLLKYGTQMMMRLSRSQQHLGSGRFLTTKSGQYCHRCSCCSCRGSRACLCDFKKTVVPVGTEVIGFRNQNANFSFRENDDSLSLKDVLWQIMNAGEIIKSCPAGNPHFDKISEFLEDLLESMTHRTTTSFLYELARRSAPTHRYPSLLPPLPSSHTPPPPPPIVIDSSVKDFVNNLPTNIIPYFEDLMVETVKNEFYPLLDVDIICNRRPEALFVIADVSHLQKEYVRVFVAGNLVLVIGRDKDKNKDKDTSDEDILVPKKMVELPDFSYVQDDVKAYMIRDKLKIIFRHPLYDSDSDSDVFVKDPSPKIYQVHVDDYFN